MKNIPHYLQKSIQKYEEEIKIWFSEQLYQRMRARDPKHPLVRLETILDFSRMEQACADYHHHEGVGQSVTHTVKKMLRVLCLRYLNDLSLRETEMEARYNLMSKWFAGYHLFEMGPDHTRIHEFEKWLMKHHPRLMADEVLRQIDIAYPEERKKIQRSDTFAVIANAKEEGCTERLRHGSEIILRWLRRENADGYEQVMSQLDAEAIWQEEKGEEKRTLAERQAIRQRVGGGVLTLLRLVKQVERGAKTAEWVTVMETVLDQIFAINELHGESQIACCRFKDRAAGEYFINSMTDPEASRRNHGPNKQDFGYNTSVMATDNFIREIEARPGSEHDCVAIPDLLQSQKEHHDLLPPKLLYDQAAGTGKTAAAVDKASDGQTQLVVKPVIYADRSDTLFSPYDFHLSPDESFVTCPNSKQSLYWYRSSKGEGRCYIYPASSCRDCSLLELCHRRPGQTKREVFINDHQRFFQRLLAYAQTPEFAREIASRPQIERIIATLTRFRGARHARFRGQAKVNFQMKMAAMSFNLHRWLCLPSQLDQRPPPCPASTETALATLTTPA